MPQSNLQIVDRLSDLQTKSLGGGAPAKLKTFTVSTRLRGRSLVEDTDLTSDEILELLDTASRLKRMHRNGEGHTYLPGKTLGMVFQHPSTRTRVSFEAGMAQLGGTAFISGSTICSSAEVRLFPIPRRSWAGMSMCWSRA